MSIRAETYIIYGRKLDTEKVSLDEVYVQLEPLKFPWRGENAKGTFGILWDSMNSDYVIAGYCIDVGTEWDGPQMELNEITIQYINSLDIQTTDWMNENILYTLSESEDNKLYILTHYH